MAAATRDRNDNAREGNLTRMIKDPAVTIYAGTLVNINSNGQVRPCRKNATDRFIGVAQESIGAVAGDVLVRTEPHVVTMNATGMTQASVGDNAYGEDDQTVDDATSANARVVGTIVYFNNANSVDVLVRPEGGR